MGKWICTLTLTLACALCSLAHAAERAIEQEVRVPAPVERVWRAWTTSEGIRTFFAPDAKVELAVGGPFEIYINPYAPPGMRGADEMRIIGFQENVMLSFTWTAPPSLPEARKQRTVVIVRFKPEGTATRVHLTHVAWGEGGEWDQAYDYFAKAWPNILGNLKKSFAEGPVDWKAWLEQMRRMTPAS